MAALGGSAAPPPRAGTPGGVSAAASGEPGVGSEGLGDRLFPSLGNGGYDVLEYDLSLRYPGRAPQEVVTGSVTVTARATQDLSRFTLDFAGRRPTGVSVDGAPAQWRLSGAELAVTPVRRLQRGQEFAVRVQGFGAVPTPAGRDGPAPFFLSRDGSAVAAQPAGAHLLFPANDHPSDKAAFTVTLDTVDDVHAVANGVLAGRRTAAGRTVWRYEQRDPMATNLIQVAVGDFTVTDRGRHDGVAVRDVTPTRLTGRLAPELAVEVEQLAWMRARVGPFPFPVYGSLVVDAPLGFALETQTLSVFDLAALTRGPVGARRPLMVHELAHQWFGNSVSPSSWSDLWLSEGHATWYELLYAEENGYLQDDAGERMTLEQMMRRVYGAGDRLRQSFGPVARPVSAEELFSPQAYLGGALVLYALRQEIGTAAFERLQRTWVTRYEDRSASTADFVATASSVAGRDLEPFLGPWLHGDATPAMPGHPDWTVERS